MTIQAGIDIGSRTIKLVLLEEGCISKTMVTDTTFDPMAVCRNLLDGADCWRITATGYGRRLFARDWSCNLVSEIKAVGFVVLTDGLKPSGILKLPSDSTCDRPTTL